MVVKAVENILLLVRFHTIVTNFSSKPLQLPKDMMIAHSAEFLTLMEQPSENPNQQKMNVNVLW